MGRSVIISLVDANYFYMNIAWSYSNNGRVDEIFNISRSTFLCAALSKSINVCIWTLLLYITIKRLLQPACENRFITAVTYLTCVQSKAVIGLQAA